MAHRALSAHFILTTFFTLLLTPQALGKKIDIAPYVDAAYSRVREAIDSEIKKSAKKFNHWEKSFDENAPPGANFIVEVLNETRPDEISYDTDTEIVTIAIVERVTVTGIAKWKDLLGKSHDVRSKSYTGEAKIICTHEKGAWHVSAVLSIGRFDIQISEEAIKKLLAEDYEGGLEDIISDNVTRRTYSNYNRLVRQASQKYGYTTYDRGGSNGEMKRVPNYYFVSFDFVKWASPRTGIRWIVESIFSEGAYAEKIEAEVAAKVEPEAEAFWKWLESHATCLFQDAQNDAIQRFQASRSGKDVLEAFLTTRDKEKRRLSIWEKKQIRFRWQPVQFYNRVQLGGEPVGPRHLRRNHAGFLIAFVDPDTSEGRLNDDNFDEVDERGNVLLPTDESENGGKNSHPGGGVPGWTLRQWCLVPRYYWDCCSQCWFVCYEWIPCCVNPCEFLLPPCHSWEWLDGEGANQR